ncbi:hypothetical protein AB9P05_00530 [Roseivirga sp. BDSF3-8]|uniref:hypothetical protein n=1 Tax=Roseivirga sp. BDSF3-8 TaxID=3241598 RepID=UPI0035326E27
MIEIKRASTTLRPTKRIVVSSTNTEGYPENHHPLEITNATSSVEWVGEQPYSTLPQEREGLSSSASSGSVRFLTAVRFDLFEELNRMYDGWQ